MKAALYVKTSLRNNNIGKPQRINTSVNMLWGFAASSGYDVKGLYHDVSKAGIIRAERDRLIAESEQYDALFLSSAFHLNRTTRQFFLLSKDLQKNGLEIHSIDHGIISVSNEMPNSEPLRVATYYCHLSSTDNNHDYTRIQNEVFKMFVKKETSWILVDQYIDELSQRVITEQRELMRLIENKDKYDIILVSDFGNLNWDTSRFFNIRDQLEKDIFSLDEGFLIYRKDNII